MTPHPHVEHPRPLGLPSDRALGIIAALAAALVILILALG